MPRFPDLSARRWIAAPLLAAGGATAATAAVPMLPGLSDVPHPDGLPAAWIAVGNDGMGGELGDNSDDFRTHTTGAGVHRMGWLAAVEHALLTDRAAEEPTRTDQVSLLLGHRARLELDRSGWLELAGGTGLRLTGDFAGRQIQDSWHDASRQRRYPLRDDDIADEAVAWMRAAWLLPIDGDGARPGCALETSADGLASSGGELLGDLGARLLLLGADAHAFLGATWHVAAGEAPNATARAVARHEEGLWLRYGLGAGGWSFDGAVQAGGGGTSGAIGWHWDVDTARPTGSGTRLDGAWTLYDSYDLGLLVGWRPRSLDGLAGDALSTWIEYRFGRDHGPDARQSTYTVDRQLAAGLAWTPAGAQTPWFRIGPVIQLGAGLRYERIEKATTRPAYPDQEAIRPVLSGAIGLRLFCAGPGADPATTYGLSLLQDAWLPLGGSVQVVGSDGDRRSYLTGGTSIAVRFHVAFDW